MQIYMALGANLGDRHKAMRQALQALDERIGRLVKCSSFYETEPVDFESEHLFLNAVAELDASLSPMQILNETQAIEREMGRTQKSHGGLHFDRNIDLDLLLYGDLLLETPQLILPHPRLHERQFVLEPLVEIAPDLIHPVFKKTMTALLQEIKDPSSDVSGLSE